MLYHLYVLTPAFIRFFNRKGVQERAYVFKDTLSFSERRNVHQAKRFLKRYLAKEAKGQTIRAKYVVMCPCRTPQRGDPIVEWDGRSVWVEERPETPYPGKVVGKLYRRKKQWAIDDRGVLPRDGYDYLKGIEEFKSLNGQKRLYDQKNSACR